MKNSWRKMKKSPYLSSTDIDGQNLVLTIKNAEQKLSIGLERNDYFNMVEFLEPNYKPMLVNTTNSKVLEVLSSSEFIEDWIGLKVEITTQKVTAFGEVHNALRFTRKRLNRKKILDKSHAKWEYTINKIKNGSTTVEVVRDFFDMSEEVLNELKAHELKAGELRAAEEKEKENQ